MASDRLLYDERPIGSLANGGYSKGDTGKLQLIKTTCKAIQTHGCENQVAVLIFRTF